MHFNFINYLLLSSLLSATFAFTSSRLRSIDIQSEMFYDNYYIVLFKAATLLLWATSEFFSRENENENSPSYFYEWKQKKMLRTIFIYTAMNSFFATSDTGQWWAIFLSFSVNYGKFSTKVCRLNGEDEMKNCWPSEKELMNMIEMVGKKRKWETS